MCLDAMYLTVCLHIVQLYAAEDQTRVLVTVEEGVDDFTTDPSKRTCARK